MKYHEIVWDSMTYRPLLNAAGIEIDSDQVRKLSYNLAISDSQLVPLDSIPDFIDFLQMVGYIKRADLENRLSFRVQNKGGQTLNCSDLVVDLEDYKFLYIRISQMKYLHRMLQKLCGKDNIGMIDFWIQDCMTQAKISEGKC